MAEALTELFGRLLGIGSDFQLTSHGIDITPVCAGVTITVGAETTNVIPITVQFEKADGSDMDAVTHAEVYVFADAAGLAAATTGGSTGIAAGTDGAIISTLVAKKHFVISSEADGDLDLTWTDTATESVYLGVKLPGGRMVFSSVIACA
jgi:hypothetical protein